MFPVKLLYLKVLVLVLDIVMAADSGGVLSLGFIGSHLSLRYC